MKKEEIVKQLVPGIILGIVLGTVIGYLVGVDKTDVMKNNIGGLMACLIPCILNCTIVILTSAKTMKRKISLPKAFVMAIPVIIIGALLGLFFHIVILQALMGIDTCTFTKIKMTLVNMLLGVVVSTLMGYVAILVYIRKVKYTRRK